MGRAFVLCTEPRKRVSALRASIPIAFAAGRPLRATLAQNLVNLARLLPILKQTNPAIKIAKASKNPAIDSGTNQTGTEGYMSASDLTPSGCFASVGSMFIDFVASWPRLPISNRPAPNIEVILPTKVSLSGFSRKNSCTDSESDFTAVLN